MSRYRKSITRLILSDPLPIPIIPKAVWEGKCACCGGRVWADEPPLDIESVKETDCGS